MPKIWKVKAGLPSWKMLTLLSGNIFMCPHLSVSAMIAQLNGLTTSEMVSHTFFVFDLICPKNGSFSSWLLNQNLPHLVKKNYFFFSWNGFSGGQFSRWAVSAQCVQNAYGPPTFQSSGILSRQRTLDDANLDRAKVALREFNIEGL